MRLRLLLLWLGCCAAPAGAADRAPQFETRADPQPYISVTVKKQQLRARLSLGFDAAMLVNPAPAQRLRFKAFPLIGKRTVRDPLLPGGEVTFRGNGFKVAADPLPRRTIPVVWPDKAVATDADVVLSVFALAAERVVITQPEAPQQGGRAYVIVRDGEGDAETIVQLGGEEIRVALDLHAPRTMMNARAAAALVAQGLVRRTGRVGLWSPFPQVELPYEALQPVAGATLLGLPLRRPAARITEARARELDARAAAGSSTAADDADAIVVTAPGKRDKRRPWILIGRDVLGDCARIEMDRASREWRLNCNFTG